MSKSDTAELNMLKLLFNATAWANIADNAASSPLTNLFVALHTADPGDSGTQATSEATYTSYARVSVARTTGGWTCSGTSPAQAVNAALIAFPACTGGTNTITHVSLGVATSGATAILYSGALSASLLVSTGITPQFAIGALVATED
ncbi:MAG TPA: hypothetical protein VER11_34450 [Polyangiaceae bacterium]|nr:hypothetical protein [Polyangiaceae bacterium]